MSKHWQRGWGLIGAVLIACSGLSALAQGAAGGQPLPPGLFDADPLVRVEAIGVVQRDRILGAEGKLADMARNDKYADARRAACEAIAELGFTEQVELLEYLAAYDANAQVRSAAAKAARKLTGQPEPADEKPIFGTPEPAEGEGDQPPADPGDDYVKPTLKDEEPVLNTRHFAFGLGSMGGYGIAALNLRFRIQTGNEHLPSVGIELGGGWTPHQVYMITSGLLDEIDETDPNRWKLISGGGAVLLYFHRMHYVPLRCAFDIGQGPYVIAGYGFEGLNEEGFFSWGVEVGILIHTVATEWTPNITDCEDEGNCGEKAPWPVVPYVRFVLHFYLV